jgi:putative transposase
MPRAHRHFIPGHIWHITHRCHEKEFLLEKPSDRQLWLSLLRETTNRFSIPVLGFSVTCNHIHLLVQDPGPSRSISKCIQIVQGQFAQNFNRRNQRINSFWGDRYHATAVDTGSHLRRCLLYIDMNMVRTEAVNHPCDWEECGCHELMHPRTRLSIIDKNRLAMLLGISDIDTLRRIYKDALEEQVAADGEMRQYQEQWTRTLAVGSHSFIESFSSALNRDSLSASRTSVADEFSLREQQEDYGEPCSFALEGPNMIYWDESDGGDKED